MAYIAFKDIFTNVEPNLDKTPFPSKFAAFGRLSLNLKKIDVLINYSGQTVTFQAELYPRYITGELDQFNFDADPARGLAWNLATETVHRGAPPDSTSFIIYGKGVSKFQKTYVFKDF